MPPFLTANIRLAFAVAVLTAAFFAGDHYRGMVDKLEADRQYRLQQEANAKAQAEMDKRAKIAELELAAERTQAAALADQWEKERNAKDHTVCPLSAATRSLLARASRK